MVTLAFAAMQDPAPGPADGVISGRVILAGGTEGIPQAEVVLAGPLSQTAINAATSNPLMIAEIAEGTSAPFTSTTTDVEGRFSFRNLAPGQYAVRAQREGYLGDVSVITGAMLNVASASVSISAESPTRDVSFAMIRGGTISGRVRDANGQPVPSRAVTAFQIGYDARSGREYLIQATSRMTDDRGDYRLYWLVPGDYYVGVNSAVSAGPGLGLRSGMVLRTFYPNAADARSSSVIKLAEGVEFSGADIDLRPLSTFKVSGRIEHEVGEITPNTFYLLPADTNALTESGSLGVLSLPNQGARPGLFEIQGVPSGSYDLVAALPDRNRLQIPGRVRIDVGSADVEGVTLPIGPGVEVKARVLLDGKIVPALPLPPRNVSILPVSPPTAGLPLSPPSPQPPVIANLPAAPRVTLRSKDPNPALFDNYIAGTVTSDEAGGWVFPNVPPSTYTVDVSGVPNNAYVEDIRSGNVSVVGSGLTILDRAPETIEIFLRSGTLSILGGVQDADGNPVKSATVVLVPASERRQNPWLYKTIRADASGEFRLNGVAPGEYKLFAWENLPNAAYRNTAFLEKYESRGLSVNLVDGGNLDFDLTVIPASELR
jgi:hypothetical protein